MYFKLKNCGSTLETVKILDIKKITQTDSSIFKFKTPTNFNDLATSRLFNNFNIKSLNYSTNFLTFEGLRTSNFNNKIAGQSCSKTIEMLPTAGMDIDDAFINYYYKGFVESTRRSKSHEPHYLEDDLTNGASFKHIKVTENINSIRRFNISYTLCLPVDTYIHIMCGSRDVIHS